MSSANQFESNWWANIAPKKTIYSKQAASGTYQASSADLRKLHIICSDVALYIAGGAGSSVTVSLLSDNADSGHYVAAGTQFPFHPVQGRESLGWITVLSPVAGRVTISVISG